MMPGGALQRFARRAEASLARPRRATCVPSRCLNVTAICWSPAHVRWLVCVRACSLLFARPAASLGKYRLIPDRHLYLADFEMSDAEWDSLRVPVGMCFIVVGVDGPLGFYPGPMGATEATVDPATWTALQDRYPILRGIDPDVEALLVNRARGAKDYFIAPIDTCFSLAGLIRTRWRGLSGGNDVWVEIGQFFDALRKRSRTQPAESASCQSATT